MSGNGAESAGLHGAAPGLAADSAPGLFAADVRRLARHPGNRSGRACARAAATRWCTDQGLLAAALASEMLGLVSCDAALDPEFELGASVA